METISRACICRSAVSDLYMVIFDAAVKGNPAGHGREGFYFGENGEHSWLSISQEISRVLAAKGLAKNDQPTTFSTEELIAYFGSEVSQSTWTV